MLAKAATRGTPARSPAALRVAAGCVLFFLIACSEPRNTEREVVALVDEIRSREPALTHRWLPPPHRAQELRVSLDGRGVRGVPGGKGAPATARRAPRQVRGQPAGVYPRVGAGSSGAAGLVIKELQVDTGSNITNVNYDNAEGKALTTTGAASYENADGSTATALRRSGIHMDTETEAKGGGAGQVRMCSFDIFITKGAERFGQDQLDETTCNPYRDPGTTTGRLERV